jgi:hypothetical protein
VEVDGLTEALAAARLEAEDYREEAEEAAALRLVADHQTPTKAADLARANSDGFAAQSGPVAALALEPWSLAARAPAVMEAQMSAAIALASLVCRLRVTRIQTWSIVTRAHAPRPRSARTRPARSSWLSGHRRHRATTRRPSS